MIKNAQFSGYYFYMNLNIQRDFQICISVPLSIKGYFIAKNTFVAEATFKLSNCQLYQIEARKNEFDAVTPKVLKSRYNMYTSNSFHSRSGSLCQLFAVIFFCPSIYELLIKPLLILQLCWLIKKTYLDYVFAYRTFIQKVYIARHQ